VPEGITESVWVYMELLSHKVSAAIARSGRPALVARRVLSSDRAVPGAASLSDSARVAGGEHG